MIAIARLFAKAACNRRIHRYAVRMCTCVALLKSRKGACPATRCAPSKPARRSMRNKLSFYFRTAVFSKEKLVGDAGPDSASCNVTATQKKYKLEKKKMELHERRLQNLMLHFSAFSASFGAERRNVFGHRDNKLRARCSPNRSPYCNHCFLSSHLPTTTLFVAFFFFSFFFFLPRTHFIYFYSQS